jgi:hypothetical protein
MDSNAQEMREFALRQESQWADARARLVVLLATLSRRDQLPEDGGDIASQRAAMMNFAYDVESVITTSLTQVAETAEGNVELSEPSTIRSTSFMTALTSTAADTHPPNDTRHATGVICDLPVWSSHTIQELGESIRTIVCQLFADVKAGTQGARYSEYERPLADDTKTSSRHPILSITGGKYLTAAFKISLGQRDFVRRRVQIPLSVKLDRLARMHVLLYDDLTRRAWLVDGASTALHLLRIRLNRSPYKASHLFNMEDFCHTDGSTGPVGSTEALLANRHLRLLDMGEEASERSGSKEKDSTATSYWTVEDVILEIWSWFEKMSDILRADRMALPSSGRMLKGYSLADLTGNGTFIPPTTVDLASRCSWVDFVHEIEAIPLIGQNLGDIIRMSDHTNATCPQWAQVPLHQDYLTVRLELLREIHARNRNLEGPNVKLSSHAYWYTAHSLFEQCGCKNVSTQGRSGMAQVLLPEEIACTKHYPDMEVLFSGNDYQSAAVIFGQSRFWKLQRDRDGNPQIRVESCEHEMDEQKTADVARLSWSSKVHSFVSRPFRRVRKENNAAAAGLVHPSSLRET